MTGRTEIAPAREPGIGGPVDLAGIRRYRKIKIVGLLIWAIGASVAVAITHINGSNWHNGSAARFDLPANDLIMQAYFMGLGVLMVFEAGNATEAWLAILGALWAALMLALAQLGIAVSLVILAPDWPGWLRLLVALFTGFALMMPPVFIAASITHRRRKRLGAAEEGDA